jgi:two-component system sensor kinase FixL
MHAGSLILLIQRLKKIFGYASEEMLGNNISMLMPDSYRRNHDSYMTNYAETGEKKVFGVGREVEGQRKDRAVFPMSLALSELIEDGARIFTGIVCDITARKNF